MIEKGESVVPTIKVQWGADLRLPIPFDGEIGISLSTCVLYW